MNAFRDISENADSIAALLISSKLSSEYSTALQALELARKKIPETKISIMDSHTAAGALGLVVLQAARAAKSGATLEEVLQIARDTAQRVRFYAALETLSHLAKGGRIGGASAWIGNMLNIKPIVTIDATTGEVAPVDRPRTKSRAIKRILELTREHAGTKPIHVNIMHANVPVEAEELRDQIASQFNCSELFINKFTPVMGAHTGPGLVGIAVLAQS